jgi:hypothetical protein
MILQSFANEEDEEQASGGPREDQLYGTLELREG